MPELLLKRNPMGVLLARFDSESISETVSSTRSWNWILVAVVAIIEPSIASLAIVTPDKSQDIFNLNSVLKYSFFAFVNGKLFKDIKQIISYSLTAIYDCHFVRDVEFNAEYRKQWIIARLYRE